MTYKIFNPKEDIQGNVKDNIYIVMDESGYIGNGFVYPKISTLTPNHPLNIFIDINLEEDMFSEEIADRLYHRLKRRAKALSEASGLRSLLYYGSETVNYKTDFFRRMDFEATLYTLKLSRSLEPILHKTIQYRIEENHDGFDDLIELHNKTLIKPIDDEVLHRLSHKDDFKVTKIYDKELIATMLVYKEDGAGYVDHIVVDKSYRNKGIGRYLLAAAIDYFRMRFCQNIKLEVWSPNEKGMAFYKKFNFEVENVTETYVGKHL